MKNNALGTAFVHSELWNIKLSYLLQTSHLKMAKINYLRNVYPTWLTISY